MPYTPPSRGSPASSNNASPVLTRNHSYDKSLPLPRPDAPPRSRSATYLQKHRRTPSLADSKPVQNAAPAPLATHSSTLGVGLTMSPIESGSSEDDEERGRQRKIQDLAESLRESMVVTKRTHSPQRTEEGQPAAPKATPAFGPVVQSAPSLGPEARKIIHSRSSSDIHLSVPSPLEALSTTSSPGDSDDEDEGLIMKRGPLIRKKSGELVKPALRRGNSRPRPLSAPGTPTYSKAVHFNDNIEQVRHFLQVDRPIAVSAGSSPVEVYDSESDYPFSNELRGKPKAIEWTIRTANFPTDPARQWWPCHVEDIHLSQDSKTLVGSVAVANLAFQKWVTARFTLDYWKTTSEVAAEFNHVPGKKLPDGCDRFQFAIKLSDLANLQNKTMLLCVRYNAGGQEHWDNNYGNNFQIDFQRKVQPKQIRPARSAGGIPRSRQGSNNVSLPRPRSFPAAGNVSDDEFTTTFDSPFPLRKSSETGSRGRSQRSNGSASTAQHHGHTPRLSNRYDFGASLHAALSTAQNALGEQSGLKIKTSDAPKRSNLASSITTATKVAPAVQPVNAQKERPELHSAEYNDLIQKFCYFGSGGNNSGVASPTLAEKIPAQPLKVPEHDGQLDSESDSNVSSAGSSTSNSPPSPKPVMPVETATPDSKSSTRTTSPNLRAISPRLLPFRSPSPALSGYQEFSHQGPMIQSTQC